MAEEQSDESKIHDPTPRRLEDLRRKGEIPRSADLTAAIAYGAILLAFIAAGPALVDRIGSAGATLIGQADRLSRAMSTESFTAPLAAIVFQTGIAMTPVFAAPVVLVVLSLLAQRALIFSPQKLAPKLSRISLVQNAKNKFGLSGLVEFLKSFAKLILFSAALGLYAAQSLERLVSAAALEPRQAVMLIGRLGLEFLAIITAIALVIGAIDLLWQIVNHRRKNRMSHKELRDEVKESEGDPYLKERRRQKGLTLAQNTMLADVRDATVVVTNPTHYAVALKWSWASAGAPVCVAKGTDQIALRIREVAEEERVPIHEDAPTARALFATVEIGDEVAPELYAQVAAAIRFAEDMRTRAKRSVL